MQKCDKSQDMSEKPSKPTMSCKLTTNSIHQAYPVGGKNNEEFRTETSIEDALRESEERYRTLIELLPDEQKVNLRRITDNMLDIVTQVDTAGNIEYVSPSVKKIMGYEPCNLLGKSIFGFVHPDDLDKVRSIYQHFISGNTPGKAEFRFRHMDGHHLWVESVGNILYDDDNRICGAILGTRDITQRKQLEKKVTRLDQLNLVGEMAASIGHEIRNPMTTARGFLQLLKSKEDCAGYVDYFDLIIEELDRANSIITEFLLMAKNKKIYLDNCSLNNIINAIAPLIRADAALYGKSVEIVLSEIPDLLLDEKEIRQLILNLVLNGLEAMEARGTLLIRTYCENGKIVLSVKDQGKGINPEFMEKLGTPFFTTKEKGTGLGLAVCYSIAARHNATIDVITCPTGTNFLVRFKPGGMGQSIQDE